MNVLLVDDDPEIRMITSFLLEQGGHDVTEAEDAAQARVAFMPLHHHLVLMDVMLGDDDGVALAEELLAGVTGRAPKFVFLTGASRPDQLERMNATDAAGVLQKPFNPTTFLDTLHSIVGE